MAFRDRERDGERRIPAGFKKLPSGVVCADCGGPWEPICSTRGCAGRETPLYMLGKEGRGYRGRSRHKRAER